MKIAFINLPMEVPELMYIKSVQKKYTEVGQVLPNLSSAYMAAWLKKHGHDVVYIEAFALRMGLKEVIDALRKDKVDVICISLITELFKYSLGWIKKIKNNYEAPVIVGGTHTSVYPKETMVHDCIDYCVVGDGWTTILELLDAIENKKDLAKVKGIIYRENGMIKATPKREETVTLNDVPHPARHLLPNKVYTTLLSQQWPVTVAIAATGCPFRCSYCDVRHLGIQFRSVENMVSEIKECVEKFGIREIHYQDETFTVNKKRTMDFCNDLIKLNYDIKFSIRTRADCIDEETTRALAKAGCYKIHIGIESADEKVLQNLGRKIYPEQVRKVINWCDKYSILTLGFVMIGNPGERDEEIRRTVDFVKTIPLDFIQVNKLTACPLSDLYERVKKETGVDYWREYTLGNFDKIREMGNYFSELSPARLDYWQKRFFREFYFRPSYIWRRIRKLKSFREFKAYLKAALSII